jgi:hypothetical protein
MQGAVVRELGGVQQNQRVGMVRGLRQVHQHDVLRGGEVAVEREFSSIIRRIRVTSCISDRPGRTRRTVLIPARSLDQRGLTCGSR